MLEEWPSGLRQRIANPSWAAPSTASSNLASSVVDWPAGKRRHACPRSHMASSSNGKAAACNPANDGSIPSDVLVLLVAIV